MGKRPADTKKTTQSDDDRLDAALEDSFPASDPPAITEPQSHLGRKDKASPERSRRKG